jgi:hypothetical protein
MVALAKAIKTAALREVAGELVTGLVALVRRAVMRLRWRWAMTAAARAGR